MHTVTLTAKGPAGAIATTWKLDVYEIENVTDQFKEGRSIDYAKITRTYDRSKLAAPALKELAHLLAEAEDPAGVLQVGKEFVARFANQSEMLPRVRRLMADCALQLGQGSIDEAIS